MAINRRLIFWLIKAYVKRWRKQIVIFFLLGLAGFFLLRIFFSTITAKFPLINKEYIGVVGNYTLDSLPLYLLKFSSHGLTSIDETGTSKPDLASSWEIKDNNKTYVIHIKNNQYYDDGSAFTSQTVQLPFSDIKIDRPNKLTLIFHLKDQYAPFLLSLSRPLFKDGLVGINGAYQVKDINFNGKFITSLTLSDSKNPLRVKVYQFYPTEEALKVSFVLGTSTKITGLSSPLFANTTFTKFSNAVVTKSPNYDELVTVFYNTADTDLSDKRLRDALSYALPNSFPQGIRNSLPLKPKSWAYQPDFQRFQDVEHAGILLKSISASPSGLPKVHIIAQPQYKEVAEIVQKSWQNIGIFSDLKILPHRPDIFQIFIGSFRVPNDPDQYVLWHSDQPSNITHYKSLRIDKLLEDGRKTIDQDQRIKIYADFQKYLEDDQPASFLFSPYLYTVTRK